MPRFSQMKLDEKMEYLYRSKIFPRVHQFVNTQRKRKMNTDALEYVLNQLYLKWLRDRSAFEDGNCWGYCQDIISKQSGNYYERENVRKAQEQKKALADFIERERVFELAQSIFREV